ncbi:hypothetical protein A2U01_0061348, partial [Trifolium medium]|nr:hypothetical protein [Trifolium medium]
KLWQIPTTGNPSPAKSTLMNYSMSYPLKVPSTKKS